MLGMTFFRENHPWLSLTSVVTLLSFEHSPLGRESAPVWRRAVDFAVYVCVRVLIAVVQAVPLEVCDAGRGRVGGAVRTRVGRAAIRGR